MPGPAPFGSSVDETPEKTSQVSVAIPTYGRDRVLADTVQHLLNQCPRAEEILVLDQTPSHDASTDETLTQWHEQGAIRWVRLPEPSITGAMNAALREACCPIVLYVDDDIIPAPGLVGAHAAAHADPAVWAVTGQVLQPGQEPQDVPYNGPTSGLRAYLTFPFHSTRPARIRNVMAGNMSVRRDRALEIGGFDESFIGVAYRFETEFARRIHDRGGDILFCPQASIRHLHAESGGTRRYGVNVRSASPMHGVGDYYFALRCRGRLSSMLYILRRPFREVCTSFHLRHPWWIPVKLVGEMRALILGVRLACRGPRCVTPRHDGGSGA